MTYKPNTAVAACLLSAILWGVLPPVFAQALLLAPQATRMTDQVIHKDYLTYEAQQARINASASANNPYATAKAQCWLDVSFQEYTRNDRSAFVDQAFVQSTQITGELAKGAAANNAQVWSQTPALNQATKTPAPIAALWQRANALTPAQRACKPVQAACGEVELVHAGNEWNQGGADHAKPYLMMAERYITQAEQSSCAPAIVAVASPAPTQAPAPVVATQAVAAAVVPAVVVAPKLVSPVAMLAQRVHFAFDAAHIAPRTATVLDGIAQTLKTNGNIKLQAVGHTDVRASEPYNLQLSMRRVAAVQAYLNAAGVMPGQVQLGSVSNASSRMIAVGAAGKTAPEKTGMTEQDHQYNRRVEFTLAPGSAPAQLKTQTDDLQACGTPAAYWCDNAQGNLGKKAPLKVQRQMKIEQAQAAARLRQLQGQK